MCYPACAAIFYGACLATAGCAAADEMIDCVEELMELDCSDMSVCGNDCTFEDSNPVSSCIVPDRTYSVHFESLWKRRGLGVTVKFLVKTRNFRQEQEYGGSVGIISNASTCFHRRSFVVDVIYQLSMA